MSGMDANLLGKIAEIGTTTRWRDHVRKRRRRSLRQIVTGVRWS
jgi:hypothetical protein